MSRFPFLSGSAYTKPNKNDEKYKGLPEVYFSDYAKWGLFNSANGQHDEWLDMIDLHKKFYMGKQWGSREDIESFLKDETGTERNRIQVVFNQVQPMLEQFRGNALQLVINARAKSISSDVINRREFEWGKLLLKTQTANQFKNLGSVLRANNKEIGESEEESKEIFENVFVDKYVEKMNDLLQYVSELNEMQKLQLPIAQNIAFSGLGVIEEFEHNGELRKEVVQSEEFGWDRNARRYDLKDAAYQWRYLRMNLPSVLERWMVNTDDQAALESYVRNESNIFVDDSTGSKQPIGNSIPVFKFFFIDNISKPHGYVKDEFDQPYLVALNEPDKYSDGKVYTEEDVIDPPDTPRNKRIFKGGKKIARLNVDVLRYCIFTPGDIISYKRKDESGKDRPVDIVYEYGDYDYQGSQMRDLTNVCYPFQCYCWAYVDGEVLSPVSAVINPQRFLNRIMSAFEGQVNESGGQGIVYEKDSIEPGEEDEVLRATKSGKAVGLRSRGRGIPNSFGTYDNTPKTGTYQLFGLLPLIKQAMQDVTGVNEALRGESTGSDQLVGVTELLFQSGSLMQAPFYNALVEIFVQSHQYTATVGKKIYIDNERELDIIAGEEGVKIFKLSEDMRNEDFRVFIKRDASNDSLRQQADGTLFTLLQAGIVNKEFFSNLYGRSTVDEIQVALRKYVKKERLAAQMAAKEEAAAVAQANQQIAAATQQAASAAKQREQENLVLAAAKDQSDKQHDLDKILVTAAVNDKAKK